MATQSFVCIHKHLKSNTVGLPSIGSERHSQGHEHDLKGNKKQTKQTKNGLLLICLKKKAIKRFC